jgi:RNA polymerase sigma-70 factor (ECF subfamily)
MSGGVIAGAKFRIGDRTRTETMASIPDSSRDAFAATRWSLITRFRASADDGSSRALGELCARYRYPVYSYLRACAHAPPIALDIAGSFLRHVRSSLPGRDALDGQQFRDFLLARLRDFLVADWRAVVEGDAGAEDADGAELERRYARDRATARTPEAAFQRAFALEVVLRAFERLREEACATGHGAMYDALGPFIARDPANDECEAIATLLHTRPLAIVVALKRLRQRLHELASEELADTVSSADELAREQRTMSAVLQAQE